MGYINAITEVSGKADDVRKKIFRNIVGAALNRNVIEKESHCIHALVHASAESCLSISFDNWLNSNYLLKIAIARKDHWMAIALYGLVATHPSSNHYRLGLGTIHI
jgi:hut operon positive regulator